jgi:hypothetical protein
MQSTGRHHQRWRARCTALRSMRSAALALAVVALPHIIQFFERGEMDAASLKRLALGLCVAVQMVLYNYLQKLREQPRRNRGQVRARRRRHELGEEEKRPPEP